MHAIKKTVNRLFAIVKKLEKCVKKNRPKAVALRRFVLKFYAGEIKPPLTVHLYKLVVQPQKIAQ